MAKETTNEDIAAMIKSGFDSVGDQFNGVDNKFKSVHEQFDSLGEQISDLNTGIQRIESKVDRALHVEYVNLEVRVKRIESKLGLKPISEPSS